MLVNVTKYYVWNKCNILLYYERMEILDSTDCYNQCAAKYYEDTVDLDLNQIKDEFITYLPDDGEILDLGCGSGRDSLYFIEKGFGVTSIEASAELAELASIHIGQEVLNMNYREINFDNVFHGIWTCASLSHMSEEEGKVILRKIYNSLKMNGILFLSVCNGNYEEKTNDFYYKEYRTKDIKRIVEEVSGLKIIDVYKTSDARKEMNKKWLHVIVKKEK